MDDELFSELALLMQNHHCPLGVRLVSWKLFLTAGAEQELLQVFTA